MLDFYKMREEGSQLEYTRFETSGVAQLRGIQTIPGDIYAWVAESVDATDLKSVIRKGVRVQVSLQVPN